MLAAAQTVLASLLGYLYFAKKAEPEQYKLLQK
jgi:hypothetical protein